jgi:hypothetical protein
MIGVTEQNWSIERAGHGVLVSPETRRGGVRRWRVA